jgi:hypothetical protein
MSNDTKQKYDMNSPEAKALIDEIVHGTFMKEGTVVAFPTCFPGASIPIRADESRITALSISPDGMIYGGTSGRATHLFVAMFHGVTGMVFDRGTVEGADHCAAVCCCKDRFIACVNGSGGGRLVGGSFQGLPFDLIQEWGFERSPLAELGKVTDGRIVHAVADFAKAFVVGITTDSLFTVDPQAGKIEVRGEVPGTGRLAVGSKGGIFGQDGPGHLWRFDVPSRELKRQAVALPAGDWDNLPLTWARDPHDGLLYTADARGRLFSLHEERGFSPLLGQTSLAPVGPMSVTHDGRVFGFCGADMAKMFCYNPRNGQITNLGVAVSVLERRRYGYVFGDAVTGRDGQIFFGEDDNLGHLWLYFPGIQGRDGTA